MDTRSALRQTFGLLKAHALKNQGPAGPPGPRGAPARGGQDDAKDTQDAQGLISALVAGEFAAFASVMQHEFWSVLTQPPPDPFAPFCGADPAPWTEWRTGTTLPPGLELELHTHGGDPSAHSLVARQTRPLCAGFFVARTICSVGTLYVVTTVESATGVVYVLNTETLSPGHPPRSIRSASVEQYLLDSTVQYSSEGHEVSLEPEGRESPACALLSRLGRLGASQTVRDALSVGILGYVLPSKDTAVEIHRLFGPVSISSVLIAVIGIVRGADASYALVVPYTLDDATLVAYPRPYIVHPHAPRHTGAAVLVMRHDSHGAITLTAVETPTGSILLVP